MTIFNVTSSATLTTALGSAVGGDTINLAAADYGSRSFTQDYSGAYVNLVSTTPLGAVFSGIGFSGCSYIKLSMVKATGSLNWGNFTTNHHISFIDGAMAGFYFQGSGDHHDCEVSRNVIGPQSGVDMAQVLGNSYNILIEENEFGDCIATDGSAHPDHLQMFAEFGPPYGCPHGITIRRNKFYDNPATGLLQPQGLYMSDPQSTGYKNMLIEENLFAGAPYRTLSFCGFNDSNIARNNTLMGGGLYLEDVKGSHAAANSGLLVQNNVCPGISQEGPANATLVNNLQLSSGQRATMFPNFVNGATWAEYIPADGTIAVGRGADYDGTWLRTKGGVPPDPPAPDPPPPIPDPILPNPAPGAVLRLRFL